MPPKTIILTGASRGIGLAIAQFLLMTPEKTNLVVVSRSKAALEQLKANAPRHVEILAGDLSDFSLGQQAVDLALSSFGQVDGLIVNHAILGEVARIADCDPKEVQKTIDVNFISTVACVKAAIPALRKSKGTILFTSSGAAMTGYSSCGTYGATKAAMNHLALTLKVEEPDITTIAIRPGMVDTEMQRELREEHAGRLDEKDAKKFTEAKMNNTLFRPEQPGNAMARLVLNAPKDLSGQFLSWDDKALANFQG